ncbi:ATP-binding protein [Dethiosulfatarculus sandiegensis]|uniref:histidine kinase n=1 Tax=Dethiosulfatarculus sandiegensis TaxID=1429043 RepID=A0A0D2HNF0_9BACT|nr:ATP-binding protein [Dethiosulfatarculus sandiegensis]KIX12073.1 sensor protein ZraS [Dethiosulfatarculus sandiegensis]
MAKAKDKIKTQETAWTWFILAALMVLIFSVLAITTLQRLEAGKQLQEQALERQGLDRVRILEGLVRATMRRGFWRPNLLETLLEEMLADPAVTGLAIIKDQNNVLAQTGAKGWPMYEKNALTGLSPEIKDRISRGLTVQGFVGDEFIVGMPFEPLRRFRRMGRSLPAWAQRLDQEPPPPPGMERGPGPHHGGHMMMRHQNIQPFEAYALVRLSAENYHANQAQALNQALLLGLLIFLAAGTVASLIWVSARRRSQELDRLRREVAESSHLAALGRLAGSVAHEVRNPLSAIRGMVQYLAKGKAPESREAEIAKTAVSEVDRLERVVSGLLEYTRPRKPRMVSLDLGESVESVVDLLGGDPRCEGVELRTEVKPDLPPALADPDQVRQVLVNLVVNAVQAVDGEGKVEITARVSGKMLWVDVADNGPGLPQGEPDQIFDPFFSTKERGTGLGLAIVRRIIKAHGGELKAQNREKGALVSFSLPKA